MGAIAEAILQVLSETIGAYIVEWMVTRKRRRARTSDTRPPDKRPTRHNR